MNMQISIFKSAVLKGIDAALTVSKSLQKKPEILERIKKSARMAPALAGPIRSFLWCLFAAILPHGLPLPQYRINRLVDIRPSIFPSKSCFGSRGRSSHSHPHGYRVLHMGPARGRERPSRMRIRCQEGGGGTMEEVRTVGKVMVSYSEVLK
eukprot:1357590-Amorphochlora_amoeboformis.AAC.1